MVLRSAVRSETTRHWLFRLWLTAPIQWRASRAAHAGASPCGSDLFATQRSPAFLSLFRSGTACCPSWCTVRRHRRTHARKSCRGRRPHYAGQRHTSSRAHTSSARLEVSCHPSSVQGTRHEPHQLRDKSVSRLNTRDAFYQRWWRKWRAEGATRTARTASNASTLASPEVRPR